MSPHSYGIGDPIEVRRATPDGDVWMPATVQHAADYVIVAGYADGTRHAVEPRHVRPARAQTQEGRR